MRRFFRALVLKQHQEVTDGALPTLEAGLRGVVAVFHTTTCYGFGRAGKHLLRTSLPGCFSCSLVCVVCVFCRKGRRSATLSTPCPGFECRILQESPASCNPAFSDLTCANPPPSLRPLLGGLDTYLAGCGPALPEGHALTRARKETWDALSGFPLGAMLLTGATFVHLGTTPELMEMMTLRLPEFVEPYGLTAR